MTSTTFRIFLLLHILSVIAAFGPVFAFPMLSRSRGDAVTISTRLSRYVVLPGLVGVLVFGALAVSTSDRAIKMADTWVSIGFVLVIIAIVVLLVGVIPAQRQLASLEAAGAEGSTAEGATGAAVKLGALRGRLSASTGVLHLVLLIAVVVMIWKPGS